MPEINSKYPVRFEYKPGEITQLCQAAIDQASSRYDALIRISDQEWTFANTVISFDEISSDLSDLTTPLTFMGYVSTDDAINHEGSKCEELLGQFNVSVVTRRDLYQVLKASKPANAREGRLQSEILKGFENAGMKLNDKDLAQLKSLMQDLSKTEAQFSSNLNNDATTVSFSEKELDGVSAQFLARLSKDKDGKYVVSTKYTDYTQVMENAKDGETRRRMQFAYMNRAADSNVKLLEQAISLRQRIAKLMGYDTWADYRIQGDRRMAKNALTVLEFLNGLKGKLAKRNQADLAKLLAYKKKLEPKAKNLNQWDLAYLEYQLKKRDYSLDDDKIREYFPADVVVDGMFKVYSELLGVNFIEVQGAKLWADGVKEYEIRDAKSGDLIAYFCTDFIPRKGKYGHFAAFPLVVGRMIRGGKYDRPMASIVGNFNPPTADKPSLLNHEEVETVFHEFGHIMHQTLTQVPYGSLSGSAVAQDFVEAPSQMLENWVWSPKILASLSGYYKNHKKKLPPAILKRMIAARDFNQGYFYTRQLYLGIYDMLLHTTSGAVDSTRLQDELYKQVIGLDPIPGGHFQAGFGHLMGGYDAGYYGYLWSKVYAEDMFTKFKKGGLLSPVVGGQYRETVLANGNLEDAMDLLRQFLGREPDSKAFFKMLHIKDSK
ncbi:MAG: Zn-dependent oligopeptidase [Oligoflexia bacterium]|nr:Zn-dependent oligopeptidase [Oligoflexia bacterium]